jgi:hypothetical protein
MKFYESHYEDYIQSVKQYNLHPELDGILKRITKNIHLLENIILYGPTGSGKYTQSLKIIHPFSPSGLKYDKKINMQTEKYEFIYRISDIHYEIDLSLLGCNPKTIWHEIFMQIVDIISVKQQKIGIILCKNFHTIHAELLDIFYSYMQQYTHSFSNIQIRFILLTEHVCFIPNNILKCCRIISVKKPSIDDYIQTSFINTDININTNTDISIPNKTNEIEEKENEKCRETEPSFTSKIWNIKRIPYSFTKLHTITNNIRSENIMNIKEMKSFALVKSQEDIPLDIFDIICNNIIHEIEHSDQIILTHFRDTLYDILIYNLDVAECFWTILIHFIKKNAFDQKDISDIIDRTYLFFKYYNNNYRPIYHLESILFYIIMKLKKYNEL